MATEFDTTCRTVGELKQALSALADDVALSCGVSNALWVHTMFEKNIATGRTRHILVIEEPDPHYGEDFPGGDGDGEDDFDYGDDDVEAARA